MPGAADTEGTKLTGNAPWLLLRAWTRLLAAGRRSSLAQTWGNTQVKGEPLAGRFDLQPLFLRTYQHQNTLLGPQR